VLGIHKKQAQNAKANPKCSHQSTPLARLPFPTAIRVRQRSLFSPMSLAFDRMQEIWNLGIGVKKGLKRRQRTRRKRHEGKRKNKKTKSCRPFHSLTARDHSAKRPVEYRDSIAKIITSYAASYWRSPRSCRLGLGRAAWAWLLVQRHQMRQ
jgi:hypothetical protein